MKKKNNKKIKNNFIPTKCPYCRGKVVLKNTNDVFVLPPKYLQNKNVYVCENYPTCDAYVIQSETSNFQGFVASEALRKLRQITHYYVDIIWKTEILTRDECYEYLASKLKISKNKCHIAMFDEKLCNKSIDICSNYIFDNIGKIKTYKNLIEEEINTLTNIISKEKNDNND